MLKVTIDNEEVVSDKDITINEEMLSASSTILNNVYPKEWEEDKDYTSRFYYPQDYSKALIQRSYVTQEAEAGTTIQVNGSVTLTDVDTTKNSRVLRLLGQTSQTGTPTPSSPIPVNVVSGDNEIVVRGKNLFGNYDEINITRLGINVNANKDKITTSGTTTSDGFLFNTNNRPEIYLEAGTYTFSINNFSGTFPTVMSAVLKGEPGTPNIIDVRFTTTLTKTFTITSSSTYYFDLYITTTNAPFNSSFNIQIEKGSQSTNFEPYQGNTYNIDLPNENYLQNTLTMQTTNGVTYTVNEDGSVNANGTSTSTTYRTLNNIVLKGGTYTFSGCPSGGGSSTYRMFVYNVTASANVGNDDGNGITFTAIDGNTYRFQIIVYNGASVNNIVFKPMLAKGTSKTFFPYGTTPIELCKIGTYQDYIYKDSDKWYLHKEIGKVVLDGSENWQLRNTSSGGTKTYSLPNVPNDYLMQNIMTSPGGYALCNKFVVNRTVNGASDMWRMLLDVIGISFYYSTGPSRYIYINTTEDLPTYLTSNNATLYYILATPTNTEITYTELLNQLNALSSQ